MFWELVENSKKSKSELKDITFSETAPTYFEYFSFNFLDQDRHFGHQRRC